jgi:F0F1-type ATP synthase membrane subunit b/b'
MEQLVNEYLAGSARLSKIQEQLDAASAECTRETAAARRRVDAEFERFKAAVRGALEPPVEGERG